MKRQNALTLIRIAETELRRAYEEYQSPESRARALERVDNARVCLNIVLEIETKA